MRIVGLAFVVVVAASRIATATLGTDDQHASGASRVAATSTLSHPGTTQFGMSEGDVLPWLPKAALQTRLRQIKHTGVRWVRLDLSWADVQPTSANRYDWSRFDRLVTIARHDHLHLLPTLAYTPVWARPRGCYTEKCAPASAAAFAVFARAAAARYAHRGINAWEIWNEENSSGFWAPSPDAKAYGTLVAASTAAIRQVQPHAFIVLGGLDATLTRAGNVDTIAFLRALCRLHINRLVNAIGYHPYTYPYLATYKSPTGTAWNKINETKPSLMQVLRHYGTPHLPIWLTEYGAPTAGPGTASNGSPGATTASTDHVTDHRQARIASVAVRAASRSKHIGALFWYTDRDLTGVASNEGAYGLRRAGGARKPAYAAFRGAVRAARAGS